MISYSNIWISFFEEIATKKNKKQKLHTNNNNNKAHILFFHQRTVEIPFMMIRPVIAISIIVVFIASNSRK
jgi:hypothetical protein